MFLTPDKPFFGRMSLLAPSSWYQLAYATEIKSIQLHDSIVMGHPIRHNIHILGWGVCNLQKMKAESWTNNCKTHPYFKQMRAAYPQQKLNVNDASESGCNVQGGPRVRLAVRRVYLVRRAVGDYVDRLFNVLTGDGIDELLQRNYFRLTIA